MPVKLRIKGTDKYLHMNSGKYLWNAAGHAKASMTTSGLSYTSMRELQEAFPDHPYLKDRRHSYRNSIPFDKVSDIVEVEEYKLEKPGALKDALKLILELEDALFHCDVEGKESGLVAKAARFRKEHA
ncbi:hypothetical protein Roomu2_00064 [Pseudomonas phage vB_PpuM-Roomu-2]|uniref:Uncharacterized protein n=1 Tax=Pseudomonas phage vB_PpuM-Roomu-2 TaxID=3132621 RepID=A0AAX4N0N4_9CAUD